MRDFCTVPALLDLSHTLAAPLLEKRVFPWEALPEISTFILSLASSLGPDYQEVSPSVWVHRTAVVAPTAFLGGPCIIGPETEVRHGAFVRGSALVGAGCVVGNSVELKNVILFDKVQTPHYNYVGDSILGYRAHMGAGSITSNVKSDKTLVTVKTDPPMETGLKKFGAILGDCVEVGCNSVLNPGCVLGRRVSVYPVSCVRGVIPADSIVKTGGVIVRRKKEWGIS
ncbi:MAG: UDP-N-acetylglucosamine pyrophosphorylase [Oscillibacter sp.]|nr:UDP-N-acetylglucosamine pyrophosphorylase [Oscillibacter sp.]